MSTMLDPEEEPLLMEVEDFQAWSYRVAWDMEDKEVEDGNHFFIVQIQTMRLSTRQDQYLELRRLRVK